MSLNSLAFVLFLPFVVCVNYAIPAKYRYVWLFAASWFFYLTADVKMLAGLLFCTVTTYGAGRLLAGKSKKTGKAILFFCIFVNILTLAAFRYTSLRFFASSLGMSFYMLQALGYAIDVHSGRMEPEKNIVKYALYVAFFPTILSGPIQRAPKLLPQISAGPDFDYGRAHQGLYDLLWGYFLKIVLANQLGEMVDFAYRDHANMPGATLLWATVLYAVQLYCDFAGYSALAIGTGKLLGFDLGRNFEQPYFAGSIREFWGRWHISLSAWLRDYIYIPLGGNRKGRVRKCVNLMATFLVSGLWHGTGANFLVWGGLHGVYQVLGSCLPKRDKVDGILQRALRMAFTFLLVDFAWLFFRADSLGQALEILQRILFHFELKRMTYYGSYLLGGSRLRLCLMLLGIAVVFLADLLHEKKIFAEAVAARRIPIVIRWVCYVFFTLLILFVACQNYGRAASTFIYARF